MPTLCYLQIKCSIFVSHNLNKFHISQSTFQFADEWEPAVFLSHGIGNIVFPVKIMIFKGYTLFLIYLPV